MLIPHTAGLSPTDPLPVRKLPVSVRLPLGLIQALARLCAPAPVTRPPIQRIAWWILPGFLVPACTRFQMCLNFVLAGPPELTVFTSGPPPP